MRLAVVALLLPALASAQREIVWSAYAGATSGKLASTGAPFEAKRGSTAGLAWTMQLNQYAAVEVGAAWVQKGGRVFQGAAYTTDVRLEYFEMPLSVRISDAMVGDGQRAFVRLGVALGTEMQCSTYPTLLDPTATSTFAPITPNQCNLLRDKTTDYGPLAGIGGVVRRDLGQLTLELRRTDGRRLEPHGNAVHIRPSTTSLLLGMGLSTP